MLNFSLTISMLCAIAAGLYAGAGNYGWATTLALFSIINLVLHVSERIEEKIDKSHDS